MASTQFSTFTEFNSSSSFVAGAALNHSLSISPTLTCRVYSPATGLRCNRSEIQRLNSHRFDRLFGRYEAYHRHGRPVTGTNRFPILNKALFSRTNTEKLFPTVRRAKTPQNPAIHRRINHSPKETEIDELRREIMQEYLRKDSADYLEVPTESIDPKKSNGDAAINENQTDSANKPLKMRIAVADFSKKIADNEGMDIDTFSYLKNEEPEKNETETRQPTKIITDQEIEMYRRKYTKLDPIKKLQRSIRLVCLLAKAFRTQSEHARIENKKFLSTFADVQGNIKDEPEVNEALSLFDKDFYKANKEKVLNQEAIDILKSPRNSRTPEMLHTAVTNLKSVVDTFGEFPVSLQQSLVEKGFYEKFESKRVIIRQGHAALNYYFILSGVNVVSVNRTNKDTGEGYSETVAFLKKGSSFGELALMYGGKRSATVSASTDVELLSVTRDDFVDIFMKVPDETEPEHISFLREIPVFRGWPIGKLPYDDPSVCLYTYFSRNSVLSRNSNANDWIYIVKTGSCRIIKTVDVISVDSQLMTKKFVPAHERLSPYLKFKDSQPLYGYSSANKVYQPVKNPYTPDKAVMEKYASKSGQNRGRVYITLRTLESGDVFGLEPIAFDEVGGTNDVTFVSDGSECVGINKEYFKKNMNNKYLSWLRKHIQPFPSNKDLETKMKEYCNWNTLKVVLMNEMSNNNHDNLSDSIHF